LGQGPECYHINGFKICVVHGSKIDQRMAAPGQERRIGAIRNISVLPPRADVGADIVEPPVSATNRHAEEWRAGGSLRFMTIQVCRKDTPGLLWQVILRSGGIAFPTEGT